MLVRSAVGQGNHEFISQLGGMKINEPWLLGQASLKSCKSEAGWCPTVLTTLKNVAASPYPCANSYT